jgi:two-component system, NtrC family, response regulator PilR
VDDEPDLRTLYELTLLREGYDVESAGTVEAAWELLQQRDSGGGYQLVITDMRLPDGTGLDLLHRIDQAGRREKAVVITAYGSAENAVEALKAGAYDYLTKPVDLRQFRAVVASALGRGPALPPTPAARGSAAPAAVPTARSSALELIVGESTAMQQVRSLVQRVAMSMAPVLVQGESGTGKELVARAIHDCSPRKAGPFVAVNCGAIPEALVEAEFFGYRKGAFTGAQEDREGFFQAAQGGTLFLDEIGELPLAMQSKLLRVIQERAVRPLGGVSEMPVNVRIVSATHRDLGAEVQSGRFRQDLFYRLNVIRITVPPLRERAGDLAGICQAVLARIARDAGVSPAPRLAPGAMQHLQRYSFPGNVRELETCCTARWRWPAGPTSAPTTWACRRSSWARARPQRAAPTPPPRKPALPAPLPGLAPGRRDRRAQHRAAAPQPSPCRATWRPTWTTWSATSWNVPLSGTATTARPPAPAWACRCARCATAWPAWAWASTTARPADPTPDGAATDLGRRLVDARPAAALHAP